MIKSFHCKQQCYLYQGKHSKKQHLHHYKSVLLQIGCDIVTCSKQTILSKCDERNRDRKNFYKWDIWATNSELEGLKREIGNR